MSVTDTERAARTKRRLGCGFLWILFAVGLLLSVVLLYALILRLNPDPPLGPWIPQEAEIAASARFDPDSPDSRSLIETAVQGLTASPPRGETLNQAEAALRFFLYPRLLVVARVEPDGLRASWAAVANVRRADRFVALALRRLFGGLIQWDVHRRPDGSWGALAGEAGGLHAVVWKTRLFLSNDPQWLGRVFASPSESAAPSPLAQALSFPSPLGICAVDRNGSFARYLDRLMNEPSSSRLTAAAAQARRFTRLLGEPAAVDLQAWLSPQTARLALCPSQAPALDRGQIQSMGQEIREIVRQFSDGGFAIETGVAQTPHGLGLELRIPAFGPWLAKQIQRSVSPTAPAVAGDRRQRPQGK